MAHPIVEVSVDSNAIMRALHNVFDDPRTGLEIHNMLAKFCNPYVPFREGVLAQATVIMPTYVLYNTAYAHYMYMGEIYGPNIPQFDAYGNIIGWWSPKDKKKHPTGRHIDYNKELHPQATDHWDKKMLTERGDEFRQQITNIIVRRADELYGS